MLLLAASKFIPSSSVIACWSNPCLWSARQRCLNPRYARGNTGPLAGVLSRPSYTCTARCGCLHAKILSVSCCSHYEASVLIFKAQGYLKVSPMTNPFSWGCCNLGQGSTKYLKCGNSPSQTQLHDRSPQKRSQTTSRARNKAFLLDKQESFKCIHT